jgi:chromosome segregation ATPase
MTSRFVGLQSVHTARVLREQATAEESARCCDAIQRNLLTKGASCFKQVRTRISAIPMAKPERQLDDLRDRLSGLLADWGTEISAVMDALRNQESLAASHAEQAQALESQVAEVAELRRWAREKELALDHLTSKSKEKDARLAELENQNKKARARIEELERQLAALDKPAQQKGIQHEEFEAMRAELAARKSLVKILRTDAERGRALEKELAGNRETMARMKESIDRHAGTIAELRRSADSWERKYRQLAEAASKRTSRDSDKVARDSRVAPPVDEHTEVDGSHTVVIDMTEPLREARDQRRSNDRR